MTAEFYLLNSSFDHINPNFQDFEDSIMKLSEDIEEMKTNGDVIYRHSDIYNCLVYSTLTLDQYLYQKNYPENSAKRYLRKVVDKAKSTTWSNTQIKGLINDQENEDICKEKRIYGFVAFGDIQKSSLINYTISNLNSWYQFHRYFLGKYPCDPENFIDGCEKVFPNVIFHERIKLEISKTIGGWMNFSNQYITSLSKLNDIFPKYLQNRMDYNRVESLKKFSSECSLSVTPEGNLSHKSDMTFEFLSLEKNTKIICCEPHIKIHKSDSLGDNTFYHNRIYFHEGDTEIANGKILVAHIGKHIDFD